MDHPSLALPGTYVTLDNDLLQRNLLAKFTAASGRLCQKQAMRLEHKGRHMELADGQGVCTKTTLVVDATGHRPALVHRPATPLCAHQVAWGMLARLSPLSAPAGPASLMDFRLPQDTADAREHPSFLYMFPHSDDLVFFEETSLASRPPLSLDTLKSRLDARLKAQGIVVKEVLAQERCVIPMGDALPEPAPGLVGWGGAGSMVHPATGYQLGRAKRWGPLVAKAAVAGLNQGPVEAARRTRQAIWTPQRQQNRALYLYGLQAMLHFDAAQQSAFFAAFFSLPEKFWRGYYEGELDPGGMGETMWRVFKGVPDHTVRWKLMRGAFGRQSRLLGQGLLGKGDRAMSTPSTWKLRPRDAYIGLGSGVLILGLWAGLLVASLGHDWDLSAQWPLALGVIALQTFLYTGVFITAHDAMHGTACWRHPRINALLGRLALWGYALFSLKKLTAAHRAHHGHPGTHDDPDYHDGTRTSFFGWYGTFLWRYISVWQILGMALVFNLLLHGLGISELSLLLFWVLPSLLSTLQLFFFGTYLTHRPVPAAPWADDHKARSNAWPAWASFLSCYHFGYHLEHHHTPHAPWWRLPSLRHQGQVDEGQPNP